MDQGRFNDEVGKLDAGECGEGLKVEDVKLIF
jgi:hypothetical protein